MAKRTARSINLKCACFSICILINHSIINLFVSVTLYFKASQSLKKSAIEKCSFGCVPDGCLHVAVCLRGKWYMPALLGAQLCGFQSFM